MLLNVEKFKKGMMICVNVNIDLKIIIVIEIIMTGNQPSISVINSQRKHTFYFN